MNATRPSCCESNALDFDDLLLEAVRLLAHDAPTRERLNQRYEFVMVDEYQDTNRSQYELMRLLTERAPQHLRGGRRGPVDLRLARREYPQHSRFRARFSRRDHHPPGAELPLDQEHPGSRQRRGREQHRAHRQMAVDRSRRGRKDHALRSARRRKRSAVDRRHHREPPGAQSAGARGGAVPHQRAIAPD